MYWLTVLLRLIEILVVLTLDEADCNSKAWALVEDDVAAQARHQSTVIVSGLVAFIALYHYIKMFNSWGTPTRFPYAVKFLQEHEIIYSRQVAHIDNEKRWMAHICLPFSVNTIGHCMDQQHVFIAMEIAPGGEVSTSWPNP